MPGRIDLNPLGTAGGGGVSDATYVTMTANATLTDEVLFGDLLNNGTLAARPAAGTKGRYYYVASGASVGNVYYDDGVTWALVVDAAALPNHLADTTDAHDASAISILDAGGYYASTDVEGALQEAGVKVPKFGGLYTLGHSYVMLGGGADLANPYPADQFSNFTHRVAAALSVPADEVFLLGKGGACASSPDDGTGWNQGTGFVLQHILPPHVYAGQITPPTFHDNAQGPSGLFVLCYGYNDLWQEYSSAEWDAVGRNATEHGLRAIISRCRARLLFLYNHSAIAYGGSGSWSDNTQSRYSTRGTTKRNGTSGGTITFTVPTTFTGGTVAVTFLAGAGAWTLANGAGSASTSLTVDSRSDFPQSGNFDILIDGVAATVSGGHGTGAGTFTLTAAKTWADNATVIRAQSGKVDWSGTATGATGSTILSGQGRSGLQIAVTKRFELTRADAGKTIIATSASLGSNEYCELDCITVEDTAPPTVMVVGQPYGPFLPAFVDTHTPTTIASLNTLLSDLCDEFDANVGFVDLETQFDAWFGAEVKTATGTGTSIEITVTDAASCRIGVGSVLRTESENLLVSAVTAQSGNDWTLTVSRNYDGSTGGSVNHAVGVPVRDIRWLRPDLVHPSDYGHRLYSELILQAVDAMPQSDTQAANAGTYVVRREAGVYNTGYVSSSGLRGLSAAASLTQNVEYATPFYLPSLAVATEIGYYVTTQRAAGTGGVGRLGIRQDSGNGRPGYLLLDAGQVSSDITTTGFKSVTIWQPMKPGWYWFCMIPQGTASAWSATVVVAAHKQNTAQNQGVASGYTGLGASAAPASTNAAIYPPIGMSYSCTAGHTGAFTQAWNDLFTSGHAETVLTGNGSGDQTPVIWVKLNAPVRD